MDFEILGAKSLSTDARCAMRESWLDMQRALNLYDTAIHDVLTDPRLSSRSVEFLTRLWEGDYFDRPLSMANKHVQAAKTKAMIIALLEEAEAHPGALEGTSKLRMLTTTPDLAIIPFAGGSIAATALGRHFDVVMRTAGVEGIGFLDVAVLHNEGQPPEWIAAHYHAAIRSSDPKFKPRKAAEIASPSKNPRNLLGAPVVKIKSHTKKYFGLRRISQLGYYISKISAGLKAFWGESEMRRSKTSLQHWGKGEALRMLEVYSHIEPLQSVRGVGETGKRLRKRFKELFELNLGVEKLPRGKRLRHKEIMKQWRRLYSELELPWESLNSD